MYQKKIPAVNSRALCFQMHRYCTVRIRFCRICRFSETTCIFKIFYRAAACNFTAVLFFRKL